MNTGITIWPEYQLVNVNDLVLDPKIQRNQLDKAGRAHIREIRQNFNAATFDPVRVVRRIHGTRKWTVVDGGHRFIAAQQLGLAQIPALLVSGRSYRQEAELFRDLNTSRRRMSPLDTFRVIAETNPESDEAIIQNILALSNLSMGKGKGNRKLSCVSAVRWAYEKLGQDRFFALAHGLGEVPVTVSKINGFMVRAIAGCAERLDERDICALTRFFWENYAELKEAADEATAGNVSQNPSALSEVLEDAWVGARSYA